MEPLLIVLFVLVIIGEIGNSIISLQINRRLKELLSERKEQQEAARIWKENKKQEGVIKEGKR